MIWVLGNPLVLTLLQCPVIKWSPFVIFPAGFPQSKTIRIMAGQFQVVLVSPCPQASSSSSWPRCDHAMLHQPLNHPQTQSPTRQHCCPLCCTNHSCTFLPFPYLPATLVLRWPPAHRPVFLYLVTASPILLALFWPPMHIDVLSSTWRSHLFHALTVDHPHILSIQQFTLTCLLTCLQAAWDMQFPAGFPREFGWWKPGRKLQGGSCLTMYNPRLTKQLG